jgi:hypothetical protein
MNHSRRFWREVERVCPEFEMAERWLKQYAGLLCRVASGPGPRQTVDQLIVSKGSNRPSSDT